jgi:hypothetical protein
MLDHSFIYGLVCPVDGRIRYVGQTKSKSIKERLGDHLRESFYTKPSYTHKERWIRKVHSIESPVVVVELERLNTIKDSEVDARECFWMEQIPNLTNSRSGGRFGNKMSDESRQKLSEMRMGEGNPNFGKRFELTSSEKAEVSERLRRSGKWAEAMKSNEFRQKQSLNQQKNTWLIVKQDGTIIATLRSASQVADYFTSVLKQRCGVANAKNARRRIRPIGKQVDKWYFVCFEQDYSSLLTNPVFVSPVRLGPAVNTKVDSSPINDYRSEQGDSR